jgi:carbon-monoxide dehydrogenase large subunit
VINAILDALALRGVRQIDMPATPERIWAALESAPKASA